MAMKLVKKTDEYTIYLRGDERYAVKGADKQPINGDEKARILVAEDLIKVTLPAEPAPEEEAAEETAEAEASAEEAPAEAAAEEAPAEEAAAEEDAEDEEDDK